MILQAPDIKEYPVIHSVQLVIEVHLVQTLLQAWHKLGLDLKNLSEHLVHKEGDEQSSQLLGHCIWHIEPCNI